MEGAPYVADCKPPFSPEPGKPSSEGTQRRATGEIVIEHTDFHKAKNVWQEKLDGAMARKEQEQILAELQQLRNSERESERATYQFLKNEGYCADLRRLQEEYDEALARQLEQEQENQQQQEARDSALAAALAAGGYQGPDSIVQGEEVSQSFREPSDFQKASSQRFSGKPLEGAGNHQQQRSSGQFRASMSLGSSEDPGSGEDRLRKSSIVKSIFSSKRMDK